MGFWLFRANGAHWMVAPGLKEVFEFGADFERYNLGCGPGASQSSCRLPTGFLAQALFDEAPHPVTVKLKWSWSYEARSHRNPDKSERFKNGLMRRFHGAPRQFNSENVKDDSWGAERFRLKHAIFSGK
jgi:hypothetical protein